MTLTSHHFLRQTQIRFQSEDASPGDYFTVRRESTAAGVSWYVRYARVTQLACRVPPAEFTLAVAEDFKLFHRGEPRPEVAFLLSDTVCLLVPAGCLR